LIASDFEADKLKQAVKCGWKAQHFLDCHGKALPCLAMTVLYEKIGERGK